MEDVEQVKVRLVREAVQANLHQAPRSQSRKSRRSARSVPFWLWGILLLAIAAGFSLPFVVSGANPSPPMVLPQTAVVPSPAVAPAIAKVPDVPLISLDRGMLPLSVRKIVIDPGHGGSQHGSVSQSGVAEKDVTLDIARRLRRLLQGLPLRFS
jgi:N-acetylmuramoyl-L-alanine amidase